MKHLLILLAALSLLFASGCTKQTEPIVMDAAVFAPEPSASDDQPAEPVPFTNVMVAVRRNGVTVTERAVTDADEIALAEQIVFGHLVLSAAWPGVEASGLENCICLSYDSTADSGRQSYYQYDVNGRHVLQAGESGMYTMMIDENYAALLRLAGLAPEASPDAMDAGSAALPAAYEAIVADYADAVQNAYYERVDVEERDAAFGEHVALEWRIHPQPVYYALCDLDGNGTTELIIGAGEGSDSLENYDIWCDADGTAVRPFDLDFGYRARFDLYAGGTVMVGWSNSAFESGFDFYRIRGAAAEPVETLVVASDPERPDAMRYLRNGAQIDETEFERRIAAYESAGKLALNWISIAEPGLKPF